VALAQRDSFYTCSGLFSLYRSAPHRQLHSFPTRRSSDLGKQPAPFFLYVAYTAPHWPLHAHPQDIAKYRAKYRLGWDELRKRRRSEEHTSELQSRENLVCRLLLEKKNTQRRQPELPGMPP